MVYFWADGIYVNVRAAERRCVLAVVGCDSHGRKHFLAIEEGFRESAESWKALLLSLRDRGVTVTPKLAVGGGAMGFWTSLAEVYPGTAVQRCWVHKIANVLDKLPKRIQPQAKGHLHEICKPIRVIMPSKPSIALLRRTTTNIPRPSSVCKKTALNCQPSTASRLRTASIYEPAF